MASLLIVGDTSFSPEMRREVALGARDALLHTEVDGGRRSDLGPGAA